MAPSAIPATAKDALQLWDAGKPVPAFEVESEGTSQDKIYALAFELIRSGAANSDFTQALSTREKQAAFSIYTVAQRKGWAAMLKQHEHESIKTITVQKPKR